MILYSKKIQKFQEGKDIPTASNVPEKPVYTEVLPEVVVTADKKGNNILDKYPYYNDLSVQDREYFSDKGPIGRGVRRRARTKEGLAKDTYKVVNPIMYGAIGGMAGMYAIPPVVAALGKVGAAAYPAIEAAGAASVPGMASVPGATVGNAATAGFATDFLVNRAPKIPGLVQKGEYKEAAIEAGIGALDLSGIGILKVGKLGTLMSKIKSSKTPKNLQPANASIKSKIDELIAPKAAFIDEAAGFVFRNRKNKKALKEGEDWLTAWTKHPATQKRIEDAYKRQREYKIFGPKDWFDERMLKRGVKEHLPAVSEYPLDWQLRDAFLYNRNIHAGNSGTSYTHANAYGNNDIGSFVSRNLNIPYKKRVGTTIHEGVHDWFKKDILKHSGLKREIESMYSPKDRANLKLWENERKGGISSNKSMLSEDERYRAYISNPTEVHARIMELRKQYNIKPDTEITDELINRIAADQRNWNITGKNTIGGLHRDGGKSKEQARASLKKLFKILPAATGVGIGLNNNAPTELKRKGGIFYK